MRRLIDRLRGWLRPRPVVVTVTLSADPEKWATEMRAIVEHEVRRRLGGAAA